MPAANLFRLRFLLRPPLMQQSRPVDVPSGAVADEPAEGCSPMKDDIHPDGPIGTAAELEEEPAHSQGLVDEEAAILEPMETKAEVEGSAEEEEMAAAMPVGDEAEGYESEEPSEEPMEEEGEESDEAEAGKNVASFLNRTKL